MYKKILLSSILLLPFAAEATIGVAINQGGFMNASSTIANGMSYAIIVDTGNDGFDMGSYTAFDITTNGQFLDLGGSASDDWFVYSGPLGIGATPPETADVFGPGAGAIASMIDIPFSSEISEGMTFAVIWFSSNTASTVGDVYGVAVEADGSNDMVIPSDTNNSAPPIALSTKFPSYTIQAVPEPSQWAMMVGGLALAAGFIRRRRS